MLNKRNLTFLTISACIIFAIGTLFLKTQTSTGITYQAAVNQKLNNALAEIGAANRGNPNAVNLFSENLANFMSYRSGVQLSQANKDSLQHNEQRALSQSKTITPADLSQILATVANERLADLSDSDIDNITETLRGFSHPNLPAGFQQARRNLVKLRGNGEGTVAAADFKNQLKEARDVEFAARNRTGTFSAFRISTQRFAISSRITSEVNMRVNQIASANPDFFLNSEKGMTPIQAMLIAYSIASDDLLLGNQADVGQQLQSIQQGISTATNSSYPSPQGHRAYGMNGYVYSSPVNYTFDDVTATKILNLIQAR